MKQIFSALLLVLLAAVTSADDQSAAKQLVDRLTKINTFSAQFQQTLKDRKGKILQATEGRIVLQKPGKFSWQVLPPYEQLVVSNGVKLWVYDADLEQATLRSSNDLKNTPAEILSGDFSSIHSAYITEIVATDTKSKTVNYRLLPKEANDFASLMFVFKKDVLVGFAIEDKLEQTTFVEFSKTKVNKKVDATQFDFLPPAGTDIVIND